MPKRVLHRRGTTAAHAAFTGGQGEVTVDTDKKVPVCHDGATAGGFPLARADQALAVANNLSDLNNAATARTNISVLSKFESHAMANVRGFSGGVSLNGASGQRIYCSLGSYSIGLNHFSLRCVFRVPSTTTLDRTLLMISGSSTAVGANSFVAQILTSGALQIRLYGGTVNDYTYAEIADFLTDYGAKAIELLIVRSWTGNLAVYVNGVAATLGATGSFGTGPGWNGSITSTYLVVGYGLNSYLYGDVYGLSLFNYPLSAAQALKLSQEGISPQDLWADDVELIAGVTDRDFSGPSTWTNTSMDTFDATGDLSIQGSPGDICYLDRVDFGDIATGRRYQIVCDLANLFGSFSFRSSAALVNLEVFAAAKHVAIFESTTTDFEDLQIYCITAGRVDIDNISLKPAGAVLDIDFTEASKNYAPDRSTNGFHARLVRGTVSADVIALLYTPRRGVILGRTNTLGNQQLLADRSLPSNARIREIFIKSDNSGTPVTQINIGTSSAGSQIASAVAISSGRNEVATFASRYGDSGEAIWINSDGSSNLDFIITFDLVN